MTLIQLAEKHNLDPVALNYDPKDPDKMKLPEGIKCGDCVNIYRCSNIFGVQAEYTTCDFSPSKFSPLIARPSLLEE